MNPRLVTIFLAATLAALTAAAPALARERVRVAIELRPSVAPTANKAPAALTGALSARDQRILRSRSAPEGVRARVALANQTARERALARLAPRFAATARAIRRVARRVERLGGRIVEPRPLNASLVAVIPRRRLGVIRRWAAVIAVERDHAPEPRVTVSFTQAIGAPSFWSAGFTGGTGTADCPANSSSGSPRPECAAGTWSAGDGPDLAIYADPIQKDHPGFAGVDFQVMHGAPANTDPVYEKHGTQVAAVAISRGVASCPTAPGYTCNTADVDPNRKGVAYGVDSVLDTHMSDRIDALERYSYGAWMLGFDQTGYDTGEQMPGASDPTEVMNHSGGAEITADYDAGDRYKDGIVDQYGVASYESQGNNGSTSGVSGCRVYNGLCVGATTHAYTATTDDDQVADYSSRGPTSGGRKKPDLVAPGDVGTANRDWKETSYLWTGTTGTSFSSPAAAGANVLLAASGLTDPKVAKAVMINSARLGRSAPANAMGTQSGWQPDWGWGLLDLTAALAQRTNFHAATVPAQDAAFYSAAPQAAGERATLVWNRHAVPCFYLSCPNGGGEGTAQPLSDLNLHEHTAAPAGECETAARASSASAIDNVEQVRATGAANVIYRVTNAASVSERFALAGTRQVTPLASPRPTVTATVGDDTLLVGETTTLTVTATNPSGQMTGCDPAIATPTISGGLELVNAAGTLTTADPGTRLTPGETFTKTWTVRATAAGAASVTTAASDRAYGSTLTGRASRAVTVTNPPVAPTDPEPDPEPVTPSDPGDGGQDTGTQDPGTQDPGTQDPGVTDPIIDPPTILKASPALKLARARIARTRTLITLRAKVANGATGRVTATVRVRLGRKLRTFTGRATIRRGAATIKVKLPSKRWKTATARVRYAGNATYRAASTKDRRMSSR